MLVAFPKPIVAAVNGPAIGLGVALLPLCDVVYASDKASFMCPYARLAQTPEACASYTFSQVMGPAKVHALRESSCWSSCRGFAENWPGENLK